MHDPLLQTKVPEYDPGSLVDQSFDSSRKDHSSFLTRQSYDWLLLRAAHRDREAV